MHHLHPEVSFMEHVRYDFKYIKENVNTVCYFLKNLYKLNFFFRKLLLMLGTNVAYRMYEILSLDLSQHRALVHFSNSKFYVTCKFLLPATAL